MYITYVYFGGNTREKGQKTYKTKKPTALWLSLLGEGTNNSKSAILTDFWSFLGSGVTIRYYLPSKNFLTPPPGPQGLVGVIFIWGPKGHFGVVLDVEIFFCFFFQNWLEMTQLDKLWMKNNF